MSPSRLLIAGGTVIDGTGTPGVRADVLVEGDRVVEVGQIKAADGAQRLDAAGLVVAPGFIDVHNHSDGWLLKLGHLTSKTLQGFTTEILASDGISYAPVSRQNAAEWLHYLRPLNGLRVEDYDGWESLGDYLDRLTGRSAQNAAMLTPYANLRVLACGWRRALPDDTERVRIQAALRRAMAEGACGLSTGIDYIAQCFADTDELVSACTAMAAHRGLYVTHVRYKRGLIPALQEAVEIGRRAGVPVHISHLKGTSPAETEAVLDYIDRVAVHEVDFSFDVYPYLPGSSMLGALLPYEVWEEGPIAATAMLADTGLRQRFAELLREYPVPLDRIRIAWIASSERANLMGTTLADYVASRNRPAAEAICDLLIDEGLGVNCVFGTGDDRLVDPMLQHPKFMLGSDGIFFPGAPVHPRQYGSAPRMLGPLVRERKLFSLEDAVRRMTSYPAERFGLIDRGVLRRGASADVVVFDPATIADRATFEAPVAAAVGVKHVLVNGQFVVRDAQAIERRPEGGWPGRALRFNEKC